LSTCPPRATRIVFSSWANDFLDAQRLRQFSLRSLRAYAYDLLHFARWWLPQNPARPLSEINQSVLLDYVRHPLDQKPKPTAQTVNHRLTVVHGLFRFHYGSQIGAGHCHLQRAQQAISARLSARRSGCARDRHHMFRSFA